MFIMMITQNMVTVTKAKSAACDFFKTFGQLIHLEVYDHFSVSRDLRVIVPISNH